MIQGFIPGDRKRPCTLLHLIWLHLQLSLLDFLSFFQGGSTQPPTPAPPTQPPQPTTQPTGNCADVYPQYCPDYKNRGMCSTHVNYMTEVCPKTCGFCGKYVGVSLVPRLSRLGQTCSVSRDVNGRDSPTPSQTSRGRRDKGERLGTRLRWSKCAFLTDKWTTVNCPCVSKAMDGQTETDQRCMRSYHIQLTYW